MKETLLLGFLLFFPHYSYSGNCDYEWQYDSRGRRCGGRAASVRPGGKLGGTGQYIDSLGRYRIYGPGNDIYDDEKNPFRVKKKQRELGY